MDQEQNRDRDPPSGYGGDDNVSFDRGGKKRAFRGEACTGRDRSDPGGNDHAGSCDPVACLRGTAGAWSGKRGGIRYLRRVFRISVCVKYGICVFKERAVQKRARDRSGDAFKDHGLGRPVNLRSVRRWSRSGGDKRRTWRCGDQKPCAGF